MRLGSWTDAHAPIRSSNPPVVAAGRGVGTTGAASAGDDAPGLGAAVPVECSPRGAGSVACALIASRAARRDDGAAPEGAGAVSDAGVEEAGVGSVGADAGAAGAGAASAFSASVAGVRRGPGASPPRNRGSGSLPNRSAKGSSDPDVESGMVRGAPGPGGRMFREVCRCSSRRREPAAARQRRRPDQQCYEIDAEFSPSRAKRSAQTQC